MRRPAILAAGLLIAFAVAAVVAIDPRRDQSAEPGDCPPDDGPAVIAPSPSVTASPIAPSPFPSATASPVPPSPSPTVPATAAPPTAMPPTATPPPGPAPNGGPGALAALQRDMEQAVAAYTVPGRYAIAVTDLQTGETVGVNASRRQLSGCSINLFVLLQATLDMQGGRYTPGEIEQANGLIASTTWSSNATAARDLYTLTGDGDTLAGVTQVDALIRDALRLPDTILDHPPLYGDISLGRGDNWLTANDANTALVSIWRGSLLTPAWRDYLLRHLATVKPGLNYLTASVAGTSVSHKNGFFAYSGGFVDNDIGIVRFAGREGEVAFAVSFLSEAVPVKYGDIVLGQQLVRLAYSYFVAAYR